MYTIFETPTFHKLWPDYWTPDEFGEFTTFLAANPEAGVVEKESGGIRKVRWQRTGSGKSGGVRVIYYNRLENGQIWLLVIYAKNVHDSLEKKTLRLLVEKLNASF